MKQKITTIVLVALFMMMITASFIACKSSQKVVYEFPDAMAKPVQAQFSALADKGKVLYDINCAGCHNRSTGGRKVIPDFKPGQLVGYELRIANKQHEAAMPDTRVTAEELSAISTFLTYKKKSGVPMMRSAPLKATQGMH